MFEKYLGGLKEPFKKELFMGGLLMIWAVMGFWEISSTISFDFS